MKKILVGKFKESFISILPITILVLVLSLTIAPLEINVLTQFLVACVFLMIGIALFTLGADTAMVPIGKSMGSYLSQKSKPWIMILVCFLLGIMVTVAEPDLIVLAGQVKTVDATSFILFVSLGVGIFLVIGVLRILFKIALSWILIGSYGIIFILAFILNQAIVPVSFDSGSVTTGPISVPFIMAFGLGLAAVRGSNSSEDSFGLIALASAGPILCVMLFMFFNGVTGGVEVDNAVSTPENFGDILLSFVNAFPSYLEEVAIAIAPITVFFLLFQFFALKLPWQQIFRILVGLVFTLLGITIFLTGVNVGFLPAGKEIGSIIAENYTWVLIPVCALIGFSMIAVEPAVTVLNKQIETITGGTISKKIMFLCIAGGVSVALALVALRVWLQFNILWVLVPAYAIALALTFFVPKIFTGIAFDSGGVSTGAMATTFAFPLIMGACEALGGNIMLDAFGTLAFVAIAPILTIQLLGLVYKIGIKRKEAKEEVELSKRVEILEFD